VLHSAAAIDCSQVVAKAVQCSEAYPVVCSEEGLD
jgi:hypothetical protein